MHRSSDGAHQLSGGAIDSHLQGSVVGESKQHVPAPGCPVGRGPAGVGLGNVMALPSNWLVFLDWRLEDMNAAINRTQLMVALDSTKLILSALDSKISILARTSFSRKPPEDCGTSFRASIQTTARTTCLTENYALSAMPSATLSRPPLCPK